MQRWALQPLAAAAVAVALAAAVAIAVAVAVSAAAVAVAVAVAAAAAVAVACAVLVGWPSGCWLADWWLAGRLVLLLLSKAKMLNKHWFSFHV